MFRITSMVGMICVKVNTVWLRILVGVTMMVIPSQFQERKSSECSDILRGVAPHRCCGGGRHQS